uniref:Uncharacterized protein n=1 Tax=Anguilla anguilla TaxID=7936 RepID=A0A0E9QV12_ANGAN
MLLCIRATALLCCTLTLPLD